MLKLLISNKCENSIHPFKFYVHMNATLSYLTENSNQGHNLLNTHEGRGNFVKSGNWAEMSNFYEIHIRLLVFSNQHPGKT